VGGARFSCGEGSSRADRARNTRTVCVICCARPVCSSSLLFSCITLSSVADLLLLLLFTSIRESLLDPVLELGKVFPLRVLGEDDLSRGGSDGLVLQFFTLYKLFLETLCIDEVVELLLLLDLTTLLLLLADGR